MHDNQSTSILRPDHHDNGVYRIQHAPSYRPPRADDDNLHRRGDEGRAHCRDGLDDRLYQRTQQERMLALTIQQSSVSVESYPLANTRVFRYFLHGIYLGYPC